MGSLFVTDTCVYLVDQEKHLRLTGLCTVLYYTHALQPDAITKVVFFPEIYPHLSSFCYFLNPSHFEIIPTENKPISILFFAFTG